MPLVLLADVTGTAFASELPALQPYLRYAISHDDNVLRTPDNGTRLGDTVQRGEAGINVNKSFGQQALRLGLNLSHSDYSQLSLLDHDGKQLHADWTWRAAPYMEGKAGADYVRELAPYTDFHELALNTRIIDRRFLAANWSFAPEWQLGSRLAHEQTRYELVDRQNNNLDENVFELATNYVASSGSRAGIAARLRQSRDQAGISGAGNYRQQELAMSVDWRATIKSRLQLVCAWVDRADRDAPERSFSGFNSRLVADWSPVSAIHSTWSAWHERQPRESLPGAYAVSRGMSLSAGWDASAKLRIDGVLRQEQLRYPAMEAATATAGSSDRIRNAGLTLLWRAQDKLQFAANFYRERRSSETAGRGYLANGISLQTRLNY